MQQQWNQMNGTTYDQNNKYTSSISRIVEPGSIYRRNTIRHHGRLSRRNVSTAIDFTQTNLTLHSISSILLPNQLFLNQQLLFLFHIRHLNVRRWRDT
ncbi:hypothetical protein Hanom_Chr13g01237341 [Helianthus anomalus]